MRSDTERRSPRTWSRRTWLQAASTVALGTGLGSPSHDAHVASLKVGRPAPALVLHTIDGCNISTEDLHGHAVILSFWATWCGPYHQRLSLLSDYAAKHAHRGLRVLGFSLDEPVSLSAAQEMAAAWSFPVGLLDSAYASGYGHIWRIPVNFTIDRNGLLADNGRSSREPAWTAKRLDRIVTPLLC